MNGGASTMKTTRDNSQLVNLLIPRPLLETMDSHIDQQDTDRAKFIRAAVREKLVREGCEHPERN